MLIWWSSIPLLIVGLIFTIKYRLREVAPILIFTTLLTLTYSILQGNVGTAYRQRAQLLIFYFVFVSIGFVLGREKREEKARRRKEEQQVSRPRAARLPESKDPLPSREKAILTN
jgi:Ca2+/Na+ antiporter